MRRLLSSFMILFSLIISVRAVNAQVSLGTVDPGPYGYGSYITVPVVIPTTTCLPRLNNKFELYISDVTGSFNGEQKIGEYAGFFTTFINGLIPAAGTASPLPPGDSYKLRVKISGTNTIVNCPGTVRIRAVTMPAIGVKPAVPSQILDTDIYGYCGSSIDDGQSMILTNTSASTTTVQLILKNEVANTSQTYSPGAAGFQITGIANAYYTASLNGQQTFGAEIIKSNKSYLILNSSPKTNIQSTGDGFGCIDPAAGNVAEIGYSVNIDGVNGIRNNYPGSIYRIGWGDGSADDVYTHCQLVNQHGVISHNFSMTSCGQPPIDLGNGNHVTNSFSVSVTTVNPYCTETNTAISYAKVFIRPIAEIDPGVLTACTNTPVTFHSGSILGNNANCTTAMQYEWYVDGVLMFTGEPFIYSFPVHGNHVVKLIVKNDVGICTPSEDSRTICIQDTPQPSFTLPGTAPATFCAPAVIKPTNTSIIDNICNQDNTYLWSVSGPGSITYDTGSPTDKEPSFKFTTPGVYILKLSITTTSCGSVTSAAQTIVVNGQPTVSLSPDVALCNRGTYNFNNTTTGPTRTDFTGTFNAPADTYSWTITGGDYTYENGTNANSEFPDINFQEFKTYIITATHKNSCATVSATQKITFSPAPTVNAGPDQNICFNDNAVLAATIDAPVLSYQWVGGDGVFSNGRNNKNTTYTPTDAERAAGIVTLTFRATTALADPCTTINDEIIIHIKPEIKVTGPPAATVCTGTALNYQLTATLANTTFSYTATGTANAGGFTSSGPSGASAIQDVLTNSHPVNNAMVTYTITPMNDGCTGIPFVLTVTITPKPVITATPDNPSVCTGNPANIHMSSNLTGTTYTWTSTVTNGVTGAGNMISPTADAVINDVLFNNGATPGTVTYTITPISANGCPGTPFIATVQVDPAVTVSNAGPDESICDLTSYTLKGNPPLVGRGTWSLTSGQDGITITPLNSENANVTGLVAGQTYNFKWTISAPGACNPSADDVNITVNIPTVAGTTATSDPATVCEAANTGTIRLTGNTGTILRWESSIDGGTTWMRIANTTATLTYTDINATTRYRAVVQNGSCDVQFSTATLITVIPATTIADAGPAQVLCAERSVQLHANSILKPGETGQWTSLSPGISIPDPSNPSTTVSNLTPGQTYTFRWTITGPSACGPTMDDVTITDHLPIANSISSTINEVCSGASITITGSTPTGGDGINYLYTWESSPDGTTWTLMNGQTARDLSTTLPGTLNFRRTVTSSTCTQVSNVLNIIAQPPITNNAITADQSICTGIPPSPLTGSTPEGSDGNFNFQWQLSEDNGSTWTDISGAVFPDYVPPVLTTTTSYRRIVSTVTCNGDQKNVSAPVIITVKPDAKAEYTFIQDKACTPFIIDAANVKAVAYPDRNSTYTWYANEVSIGTGIDFPGYTISASDQSVIIKLLVTPSQGCQSAEFSHTFSTTQSVAPSYTQSATGGCGPLTINFVNTSTSLTNATFRWDFGNGTTSSQVMPAAVTFLPDPTGKDTIYTVTLTATTPCGSSSFTSAVSVTAKPVSIFSPDKTTGCSPMAVNFSNTSPGETNTFYYDFGDGTLLTKTDKSSVSHTFTTNVVKDFVVKMIAENACGRNESSYTIRVSPNTVLPELVVNADEKQGCAPLTVHFYNNSKGANSFRYDFGDGSTLQTNSAPETVLHTFTTSGTHIVTLTASNGCSVTTTTESVTVLEQPLTAFDADVTMGCPGLPVQFNNTSTGGVSLSYLWDFGDGSTSNEFQPKHLFTGDQEYYTVSLTATNSLGCTATTTRNQYIHIVPPPIAQFNVAPSTQISIPNYTFRFEDESTNNPAIWAWDFGDGSTSALPSPSHTYLDTGKYVVTLKVTNQQNCSATTFKTVTITGVPGYLYVPNSFMPGSATQELRAFKAKGSGIASWKMSVYNKWGELLWETTKLEEGKPVEGWDGTYKSTPVQQGLYYWKIDVQMINGTSWKGMSYNGSNPKHTGTINLIR